jgi:3',5'-nucleoside bisphosphate phosphatase
MMGARRSYRARISLCSQGAASEGSRGTSPGGGCRHRTAPPSARSRDLESRAGRRPAQGGRRSGSTTLRDLAAPAPTFDLQSHSLHSDGELPPAEVVEAAARAGVELLSLTDHDIVDGVEEARRAAAAHGLALVPGVEISALDGGHSDLHILGYLIDDADAALRASLELYRADREVRATRMAQALAELGFALDDDLLRRRREAGKSIGRPHLAQAVVDHPANAQRLADEGRLEPSAFLEAYLIEGRPAFRSRERPTVPEAIETIHAAGGVAVWAHPFWDVEDPGEVLDTIGRFVATGLDGVEAFYVTHTREQTLLVADECARRGLLTTGSSDFHGPGHRAFRGFRAFETYGREPELGPIAPS